MGTINKMPDYQQGKIYRLFNSSGEYIGSTIQKLSTRLTDHRKNYTDYIKNDGEKRTTSFNLFDEGDCEIELIENYPCNSKSELLERERYYIENRECVNKIIPIRREGEVNQNRRQQYKNDPEYRNNLLDNNKVWYSVNRENVKEYTKLKMRRLRQKWKAERESAMGTSSGTIMNNYVKVDEK